MATSGPTNAPSNMAGDADFRAFAQVVHDRLAAVGLVQTSDTGQINLGTVARPAVSNTAAGYEVWRFADALQSTTPVFLKVEYGVGASTDRPSLWITVGGGSNGSGTLTGQVGARVQVAQGNADTAGATRACLAQGDGGQVHLFCSHNAAGANTPGVFGFVVERVRDATGTVTPDGVLLVCVTSGGATQTFQVIPAAGSVPTTYSSGYVPPASGRSTVGADVVIAPTLAYLGKVFYSLLGWMLATDLGGDNVFTATALGTTHTFRTVLCGTNCAVIPWE